MEKASEFVGAVLAGIREQLPNSGVRFAPWSCSVVQGLPQEDLYVLSFMLQGDRAKWVNGIVENDPAYHTLFVRGISSGDRVEVELVQGGSLSVKPDPGSYLAFGRVKLKWRNRKGSRAQVQKHIIKYFARVKQLCAENLERIPENAQIAL